MSDDERIETEHHELHVHRDSLSDFSVWLNSGVQDFDGLCIGTGTTRAEAIDQASIALKCALDKLKSLRVIFNVYRFANGMVAVFDERGEQIPAYQGKWEDHRADIIRDAPLIAEFRGCEYTTGKTWPLDPKEEFRGPTPE